jgi:triacylglycerol esterase/lipase EstA (alpha/beta hydrolase family)
MIRLPVAGGSSDARGYSVVSIGPVHHGSVMALILELSNRTLQVGLWLQAYIWSSKSMVRYIK